MSFYERLHLLCREKNISLSHMLEELGLSTGNTGSWKKGQLPKGDALAKIADYLDTSIDYIVYGEYRGNFTEDEKKLIELYRSAPNRAKYLLLRGFEDMVNDETERYAKEKGAG